MISQDNIDIVTTLMKKKIVVCQISITDCLMYASFRKICVK